MWFLRFVVAMSLVAAGAAPAVVAADESSSVPESRIQELIRQLGDADYTVRERAQDELATMGFEAFEALSAATQHEDLEIASRARYLLRLVRVQWSREGDPEEVKGLLDDYEAQATDERFKRIQALARLPERKGLAALCRLVRYEQSQLLSKLGAMEILDRAPRSPDDWASWAQVLKERLGDSSRPAVKWVLTYVRLRHEPEAAAAEWAELVEAEQASLKRAADQTSIQIVAVLWYRLATVQWEQGKEDLAKKTAQRARQLSPGKENAPLITHLEVAAALRRRGMIRWAEEEYRYVIASGGSEIAAMAEVYVAEMLHDQGNHLGAAEVMEDLLKQVEAKKVENLDILGRSAEEVRARMLYFQACHWEEQGDRARHSELLKAAFKAFPTEVDVLIACYHLPEPSDEFRNSVRQQLAKATAQMRREIEANTEDANSYNQFAWLVGNTEGDKDEALRCAEKAVELEPDSGAYHDTLAHVYAGRGDYENAVKQQKRAVELEPYSGLIAKKLKLFEEKRDQGPGARGQGLGARG